MKKLLQAFLSRNRITFLTLFLLFIFFSINVSARDYSFPSLEVNVQIEEDGSIYVEEKRKVIFDGEYSGLFQWIYKQPGEEIIDINIRDNNSNYTFNPTGEIGPSGTYFIIDEKDKTYIDWSFNASNEEKEFILSYRIKNAVKLHNDIAELYYIFTGDEWEKPIKNFKGEIIFPRTENGDIRAWGHGPLNGTVTIIEKEKVLWEINNIPSNTLVAGRVTFPLSLVPEGTRNTGIEALESILNEEKNLADQANRDRRGSLYSIIIGILAFIGGIGFSIKQWFKYGKEPRGDFDGEYYRELPSKRAPAEVGYLTRFKRVDAVDITATILDLGRRGYLKIEEYEPYKKSFFQIKKKTDYRLIFHENKNTTDLVEHEKILYKFLFNINEDTNDVTFDDIEDYSKKNKKEFVDFWEKWKKAVEKKMESEDLFEKSTSSELFKKSIPGFLLFFLPVIVFILFRSNGIFAAIGLFSAGFIYLISLASHQRRTEIGASEHNKWQAFKKFIKDFSNIEKEKIPALIIWEHYLVYAVTLGVAKEALKALELAYPNLKDGEYSFGQGWYVYNQSLYTGNAINSSLSNMTNSITSSLASTVASATGQYSSGAGAGGGFSGGGGGGASGGGGGGAR